MTYFYFDNGKFRRTRLDSDEMLVKAQLKHLFMIFESNCGCFHRLGVEFADALCFVGEILSATSIHNKIF